MTTIDLPVVRPVVPLTSAAEATTISTPADGLSLRRVGVEVDGFAVPTYVARPDAGDHLPVLLLIGESFGLHPYLEDVARRFAHEGYLVVAPDLMARQGDPADYDDVELMVKQLLRRVGDEQVLADLSAVLDWAVANGGDADRIGVNAFSWGGRWAWLFATRDARPQAVVSWYGVLDDAYSDLLPDRALFPHHPIDVVDSIVAPVLGLYAELDAVIPMQSVDEMRAALAQRSSARPDVTIVTYPGAVHGFHADWRDDYDQASAEDAWNLALGWLREHGV
jgi:carboxymethylenebutenolidase